MSDGASQIWAQRGAASEGLVWGVLVLACIGVVVGSKMLVADRGRARRNGDGSGPTRTEARTPGTSTDAPSPGMAARAREVTDTQPRWDRFRGGRIVLDAQVGRKVTFTFDDGPSHRTTPLLLENLANWDVRATFFVVGRRVGGNSPIAERNREVLREEVRQGHIIGSHSYSHPMFYGLEPKSQLREIVAAEAAIRRVTGLTVRVYRPPYGALTRFAARQLQKRGYAVADWNLATGDPFGRSVAKVLATAMKKLRKHQGGIFLMHDTYGWSAAAVPLIVRAILLESCVLLERGERPYLVVSLEHFLVPQGAERPVLDERLRREARDWAEKTENLCRHWGRETKRSAP